MNLINISIEILFAKQLQSFKITLFDADVSRALPQPGPGMGKKSVLLGSLQIEASKVHFHSQISQIIRMSWHIILSVGLSAS